ncbi:hypothetical protein Vadar_029677 [Vaccinium darrowii]|uniref:Uncharacterized protein n=1 Tax=Vaccinium darrowii TaxID=229202 RepID=A0ACB7YAT6_9ERIC|nr:hypothetical protein Vadar_029677 [Vaccinium darrowii]
MALKLVVEWMRSVADGVGEHDSVINSKDRDGNTIFHLAAAFKQKETPMAESDFLDLEDGTTDFGATTNLCLLGKVLNSKPLNANAITNVLNIVWKTRAAFHVVPWSSNNTYLFRFEDEADKIAILKDGPWSIMNNLLVLKGLTDGVVVSELDFSLCPFWVQIHGLPIEKMSRANAEIIGNCIGNLLAIEVSHGGLLLDRSFLRVKVEVNTNLPLPKGFWLKRCGSSPTDLWISYKYEKLPDFCYACGRIGHENRNCKFVSRETRDISGYGPELRTGKARKADTIVHEVSLTVRAADEQ